MLKETSPYLFALRNASNLHCFGQSEERTGFILGGRGPLQFLLDRLKWFWMFGLVEEWVFLDVFCIGRCHLSQPQIDLLEKDVLKSSCLKIGLGLHKVLKMMSARKNFFGIVNYVTL